MARNVSVGPLAADGIHCLGNCTLDHLARHHDSDETFQFNLA